MTGRLGMTGPSLGYGDRVFVIKREGSHRGRNAAIGAGVGGAAGYSVPTGLGAAYIAHLVHSASPEEQQEVKQALQRQGFPGMGKTRLRTTGRLAAAAHHPRAIASALRSSGGIRAMVAGGALTGAGIGALTGRKKPVSKYDRAQHLAELDERVAARKAQRAASLESLSPKERAMTAPARARQRRMVLVARRGIVKRNDRSSVAVGTGATVGTLGLVGGGVPGARPNSGRLFHAQKATIPTKATKHIVSATRGGIFGYREDAHRRYLGRLNTELAGWKAHSRGNRYERGVHEGKATAEKEIIRTMRRARTGSNVALGAGAALVGGGLLAHRRNVGKSQDYRSNATMTAGGTLAAAGFGGSKVLRNQGRKWSARAATNLEASTRVNPELGGHTSKHPRKSSFALDPRRKRKTTDVVPHRTHSDIVYNNEHIFAGSTDPHATIAGRMRGQAGQHRYFARVYRSSAKLSRKVGVAGLGVAGVGAGTKYLQVKPRSKVHKVDTTMSEHEAARLAGKYDTRGPLPKTLNREQRMKAYEARYVHSGGRKAEKWHRRAQTAEVGRNVGLAGATAAAGTLLAARGRRTGAVMARTRGLKHLTPHRLETTALASGLGGGWSELYGEHARSKRASYQNSPAGVAGSALSRMQAYTPEKRKP